MIYLKHIISLFLLAFWSLTVVGQAEELDCMELLKRTYKKLNDQSALSKNVFYMSYSMKMNVDTKLAGQNESGYSSTVQVYANSEKSYLVSDEIEVYQDQQHSVSIIKGEKVIYIADYIGSEAKQNKVSHLGFMQDTLFDLSTVALCEEVGNTWSSTVHKTSDRYRKIQLSLNSQGKQLFKTDALTFYIDEDHQAIKRVVIDYSESHSMDNLEVTFDEITYNYSTDKLNSGAIALALTTDNNLLPEYKDFRLVDIRSIKNRN